MNRRAPLGILTAFVVLAFLLSIPAHSGAVVSGANGRILFVSDRDGDKEIYAIRADGTGLVQLTNNTANDYDPAFSGDGSRIAFVTDRDGTPELYTMTANGANQTRITTNVLTESHPSWAPNNSAIVFAGVNGTKSYIYKIRPNGTGMVKISRDLTAYDSNPAWSPGGLNIAFDSIQAGNPGPNIYKMTINGSGATQLTTSNTDTNPSWGPDNKTIAFQSSRDNLATNGLFAAVQNPVGVAVLSDKVLVTQWGTDKVQQIDSSGQVSNFTTLPPTGISAERYLAVSPGLGGFPEGEIYATVGPSTYAIDPDGTVNLFAYIPSMPNGETGITFDTVGTFGFNMILTDRRGPIWLVDSNGNATQFYDLGKQVEGPAVAPMSFTPAPGQLLVGSEFVDQVYAISNTDPPVVTQVGPPRDAPEGAIVIPDTTCNMGGTGGAYFVALKDANGGELWKFSAGSFIGINGVLVPGEAVTDISLYGSDGTVTTFSGPLAIPELEGSAFATCPEGAGAGAGREIYTMRDDGTAQARLTTNGTDDIRPAYSADGASIVFQSDRDDPNQPGCEQGFTCKYEIYTMHSDGTVQTNISNNLSANDVAADWQSVSFPPVGIFDDFYSPTTEKPTLGGAVLWDNFGTDPEGHTVTDNSGMGLFDSGLIAPGGFYVRQFISAGQYPFLCLVHPLMTGTVKVPMAAAPRTGNLTTVFTITWATAPPPSSSYKFDVQIERPGTTQFVDWITNTNLKSSTFTADGGTGTYLFQARLHNTANGFTSNYSAPVSITVNPAR